MLKDPLFHFLLIGVGLFVLYSFLNPEENRLDDHVIKIENSDVDRLVKAYRQNWNVHPDSTTLQKLLEEEIKSEIFYREALRMQLDHNDEIIRRRLKQKYEFLVKDLADSQAPSEDGLRVFYEANQELYKSPRKLSFTQLYFNPDKRANIRADAKAVYDRIVRERFKTVDIGFSGDPFHLQKYFADRDYNDVRQLFGQDFAKAVFELTEKGWSSPLQSGYGVHLVHVSGIKQEEVKPFDLVKSKVLADWRVGRQESYNQKIYENLMKKYEVVYDFTIDNE